MGNIDFATFCSFAESVRRYLRKRKLTDSLNTFDTLMNNSSDVLWNWVNENISDREETFLNLKYKVGLEFKVCAEKLGVSLASAVNWNNRLIERLLTKYNLSVNDFSETQAKQILEAISDYCDDILIKVRSKAIECNNLRLYKAFYNFFNSDTCLNMLTLLKDFTSKELTYFRGVYLEKLTKDKRSINIANKVMSSLLSYRSIYFLKEGKNYEQDLRLRIEALKRFEGTIVGLDELDIPCNALTAINKKGYYEAEDYIRFLYSKAYLSVDGYKGYGVVELAKLNIFHDYFNNKVALSGVLKLRYPINLVLAISKWSNDKFSFKDWLLHYQEGYDKHIEEALNGLRIAHGVDILHSFFKENLSRKEITTVLNLSLARVGQVLNKSLMWLSINDTEYTLKLPLYYSRLENGMVIGQRDKNYINTYNTYPENIWIWWLSKSNEKRHKDEVASIKRLVKLQDKYKLPEFKKSIYARHEEWCNMYLTFEDKELLELKFKEGMTLVQIAGVLKFSDVNKARRRLEAVLKKFLYSSYYISLKEGIDCVSYMRFLQSYFTYEFISVNSHSVPNRGDDVTWFPISSSLYSTLKRAGDTSISSLLHKVIYKHHISSHIKGNLLKSFALWGVLPSILNKEAALQGKLLLQK